MGSRERHVLMAIFCLVLIKGHWTQDDQQPPASKCQVNSFSLQQDFDITGFQGYWYVTSIKGQLLEVPKFLSPKQNIQVNVNLMEDGTIDLKTGGCFLLGMCDFLQGKAVIDDPSQPEKATVQFTTWLGRSTAKSSWWIVSTDYDFAVIYSCRKTLDDGTCDPASASMWTFNRKPEALTSSQQEVVDKTAADFCMSGGSFQTVEQTGKCDFDPEKFPCAKLGLILIVAVCVIVGILILAITICACCASKSDKEALKKKKTQ